MVVTDEGCHEEDMGPARPPQGWWAATKGFLTKGSARWSVLVGVVLLVGTVCLVSEHPHSVDQLRQNLLLKNGHGAGAQTQALRRELSGTDPVHRAWDDVHSFKSRPQQLASVKVNQASAPAGTGDSFSQFLAATSRSSRKAHENVHGTVASCTRQCDANGYAAVVAGETAAKACVDVCLEEKGKGPPSPQPASLTPSASAVSNVGGSGEEDAAKRLLAKVRAQMPGAPKNSNAMLSKVPGDLAGLVAALGVSSKALPAIEQSQLQKAVGMDATIAAREAKDREQLTKSWKVAVKQMRTLEAARLENAQSLKKDAMRAASENKATMALDAAVLTAAAQFQQNLGTAAEANKVPVNAPKAEQQLESARKAQNSIEQAAQFAGEILSEESMKWKKGNALVEQQLNSASFVDPGSDIEGKFWASVLKDSDVMPKADASKVKLAAMTDGKLMSMERDNYAKQRQRMRELASDVRDMQAARAANAQLVAHHMSKRAAQKKADTKLLAAEASYVSTVSQIGGKSKIGTSASELSTKILKDAEQARALHLAGEAGEIMAQRYGNKMGSSAAAREAMAALGKAQGSSPAGGDSAAEADNAGAGDKHADAHKAHVSHEAHRGKAAASAMSGAQAVKAAATGWFSPY